MRPVLAAEEAGAGEAAISGLAFTPDAITNLEQREIQVSLEGIPAQEATPYATEFDHAISAYSQQGIALPIDRLDIINDPSDLLFAEAIGENRVQINIANRNIMNDIYRDVLSGSGTPLYAQTNVTDTLIHELGHLTDRIMTTDEQSRWYSLFEQYKNDPSQMPSYYAQESQFEAWAETVACIITGRHVPVSAMENLARSVLRRWVR